MAFAKDPYTATASQTDFTITFPYISESHVVVTKNGSTMTNSSNADTISYTIVSSTTVRFGAGLTAGDTVIVSRNTSNSARLVDYAADSTLTETDLDNDSLQAFYLIQESLDNASDDLGLLSTGLHWDAESRRITLLATPTATTDAVTKAYADALVAAAGNVPTPGNPGEDDYVLVADAGSWAWEVKAFDKGHLHGLETVQHTDADHDITINAGQCRDTADAFNMVLSSGQVKRIDETWATGTNAGGMSSSLTVANSTWYFVHVVIIAGTVEVAFDTSAVAANIITDHSATAYRRIGAVLTDGSANIVAFRQEGDDFFWKVPVQNVDDDAPGTAAVLPVLSIPLGIALDADIWVMIEDLTPAAQTALLVTPVSITDTAPSVAGPFNLIVDADSERDSSFMRIKASTSATIRYRASTSQADITVEIMTTGWHDRRGKID